MSTREELEKAVEDAMVAWHAADDGTTADWHFAAVAWDVAKAALDDYDMVKRMNEEAHKCNTHPNAPHGFLRNASHNEGRYVCECEHWKENT
jgi:hypothetical protein